MYVIRDIRKILQHVEKQRRRCAEKIGRFSGNDRSVLKFKRCGGFARFFRALQRRDRNSAVEPACFITSSIL